jgi:hypothetical protein
MKSISKEKLEELIDFHASMMIAIGPDGYTDDSDEMDLNPFGV